MDKTMLESLVNEGKSLNQISSDLKISQTNVRYWLKKYNLKTNWNGYLKRKIQDDELLDLAKNCCSLTELLTKLGNPTSGGAFYHYKKRLESLNFDKSKYWISGGQKTAKIRNKETLNILKRQRREILLKLLRDNDIKEECNECNLSYWIGKKILLHIHHKDLNCKNNTINNLEFLCPNCHGNKHFATKLI